MGEFLDLVVGTRPDIIKLFPLNEVLKESGVTVRIVHTGQHYDDKMSNDFFKELNFQPDVNLGEVGGGIFDAYLELITKSRPKLSIVLGDVSGAFFVSLACSYAKVPLIHVEAGLRSFDLDMPEEVNRKLIDQIADLLLIPSEDAFLNLAKEGIGLPKIKFVGNIIASSIYLMNSKIEDSRITRKLNLDKDRYIVCTVHRPSNVDNFDNFLRMASIINAASGRFPVVLLAHHRIKEKLKEVNFHSNKVVLSEPLGYTDFLSLMKNSKVVMTDSGGVQEETSILNKPCITMRQNTERPVTCSLGTNVLAGTNIQNVLRELDRIIYSEPKISNIPFWDEEVPYRIRNEIFNRFGDFK